MNKSPRPLPLLAAALALASAALAGAPRFPPAPPLKMTVPSFQVSGLPCGLKVVFLRDDAMPLVSGRLLMAGGAVLDPPGKEGLAALACSAMREGGSGGLSPQEFGAAVENRAASISVGPETEDFSASFHCLSGDLKEVLKLFSGMLLDPAFDPARLQTARQDLAESLGHVEDTPDSITRVLFTKALFGPGDYGRWASPASVAGLDRADVLRFFRQNFGPRGAVLALAGRFDPASTLAQLRADFASWKGGAPVAGRAGPRPLGPAIYFFPKQVPQVFIRLGFKGLKRHDPRNIPLQVANDVLGGSGFSSRLMRQIRSDRGLAYFAYSTFQPEDVAGPFEVVVGTRPDAVKETLDLAFGILKKFAQAGPTPGELKQAQQGMVEAFADNFESPYDLADYEAGLDFHGYRPDYLASYRRRVRAVTRAQAGQAAASVLGQQDWVMAVCGPADLEPVLKGFGRVVKVEDVFKPLPKDPHS